MHPYSRDFRSPFKSFLTGRWQRVHIHYLVGVECLARRFKERDELKWVLQKSEKEVQTETILPPTPLMNVDGSRGTEYPNGPRPANFHSIRNRCHYTIY